MSELKIILWTGGDAPNRQAELYVSTTEGPRNMAYCAYWEPGYCGCEDCNPVVGLGATEAEAIEDHWEKWGEKYD